VEEGGFSTPAGSKEHREVTSFDLKINSAQGMDLFLPTLVDFGYAFRMNDPLIAFNG
jgi:hypothetical protein